MSTRCRIGVEQSDGTIKSIYCHHDGYLDGVGLLLQTEYDNLEKVNNLVELGDISSLGEEYDEEMSKKDWHRFDKDGKLTEEENEKLMHLTVAYKDRGDDCPARVDANLWEFHQKAGNCGEEYVYLYHKNFRDEYEWEVMEIPYFQNLKEKLEKLNKERV